MFGEGTPNLIEVCNNSGFPKQGFLDNQINQQQKITRIDTRILYSSTNGIPAYISWQTMPPIIHYLIIFLLHDLNFYNKIVS